MVGGTVIEAKPMRILAGTHPGTMQDVVRLWCVDNMDECAVYADPTSTEEMPSVGTRIWWQAGVIYFDQDRRTVRKVGYSFDPRQAQCEHVANAGDHGDPNCVLCGKEIR